MKFLSKLFPKKTIAMWLSIFHATNVIKERKRKCRNVRAVARYRHKKQYLLFMFFPLRNESELCCIPLGTYIEKIK